jgi:two-component system, LytTR family, sensor kinase
MRRDLVALIHTGYWALYVLLVSIVLLMLRVSHGSERRVEGLILAWPIIVLLVAPNIVAFYAGYRPLFSRFLARRRFVRLLTGGLAASVGASAVGLILARLLFGPNQPVFSDVAEMITLSLSLTIMAAVHIVVALVIRGFVDWYGDLQMKEQLTRRTHEMELALVQSKLDPHFLFNTLNNIDVLILRDPGAASDYLNKLSEILRFMLYEAKGPTIALAEELTYIEKYMALERIRAKSARYATHEVVGDPNGLSIAPMTFIPFIENAFKHTEELKGDGAIVSRIVIDGRRILFECTNRCSPRTGQANGHGGLGHELMRQRLQMLYPGHHSLEAGLRTCATAFEIAPVYSVRLAIEPA